MTILSDPFIQTVALPALLTIVAGLFVYSIKPAWASFAIIPAVYVAATLIQGVDYYPLTATRKILILGLVVPVLLMAVKYYLRPRSLHIWILICSILLMTLWVLWPVLMYKGVFDAALVFGSVSVFFIWTVVSLFSVDADTGTDANSGFASERVSVAVMMMAVAGGLAATLAASALLGQLIASIASAMFGWLILLLVFPGAGLNKTVILSCGILIALLVSSAVVYANLPVASVWTLAVIPFLVKIPIAASWSRIKRMSMLVLVSLPAAVMSVYIAWQSAPVMAY